MGAVLGIAEFAAPLASTHWIQKHLYCPDSCHANLTLDIAKGLLRSRIALDERTALLGVVVSTVCGTRTSPGCSKKWGRAPWQPGKRWGGHRSSTEEATLSHVKHKEC